MILRAVGLIASPPIGRAIARARFVGERSLNGYTHETTFALL